MDASGTPLEVAGSLPGGAGTSDDLSVIIARLATEMFKALPGRSDTAATSVDALTLPGDGALNPGVHAPPVGLRGAPLGGGGASSAATLPPLPGFLHQPPLASAPPPSPNDLRNVVATLDGALPFELPLGLVPRQAELATPPLEHGGAPAGSGPSGPSSFPSSSATPPLAPSGVGDPWGLPLSLVPPSTVTSPPLDGPALYFLDLAGHPPAPPAPGLAAPATTAHPPVSPPPAGQANVGRWSAPDAAERSPARGTERGLFDPGTVKRDFPILRERVHGRPLVWLDNAATTQKPTAVIDRVSYFYEHENSNVHRAAHTLAARATDAYDSARDKVRRFLGAPSPKNIVFVRGTTEAINLVAKSWGRRHVGAGDEIVISWLEHHANIVPWQQLATETGARLRVAPVDDRGQVRLDEFERLLGPRTRLVSVSQVSNALGTIVPVQDIVAMSHRHGARVLVDGAQAVSHMAVDVQALDCDFYCFSGHKIFGPTGIGALYGKAEALEEMPAWQGGGNMISDVTFEKTTFHPPPMRFEAGTGNIADAVGLGAALDYVTELGLPNIGRHEHDLLEYGTTELGRVPGLRIIGTAAEKAGVLSFVIDGLRTEDIGHALDQEGIAVRAGHHCAQPILRRFGLESTVRASLAPYNTCEDLDALVDALIRLRAGATHALRR
jgi:cysteine desulfurase/selenocysteine lyase